MDEIILNVNTLPEPLHSRINSKRVKVYESGGIITLIPITEKQETSNRLYGMFSDGKLSSEKYMAQKQIDKELER